MAFSYFFHLQAAKKPAPPSSDSDDSDDDDDVDLFGSDDDETKAAAEKIKQERLAAYAAKKAKSECQGRGGLRFKYIQM